MTTRWRSSCAALHSRRAPSTAAVLGAACLAACATVGPDYHAPDAPAPAHYADAHAGPASLAASGAGADATMSAPARWTRFGDPVLLDLQRRAQAANADVAVAATRFAQSRAQRATVAAQRGPLLDARAGVARERQSENGAATRVIGAIAPDPRRALGIIGTPFTLYQAGFDASWELDLWGRVRRVIEAADADTDAAAATLRAVQQSVAAELARAYFEMRSAQRQQAALQREVDVAMDLLGLLRQQYEGGVAEASPSVRQRATVADLRARLPLLAADEARAMRQIDVLCGTLPGGVSSGVPAPAGADDYDPLPDLALGLPSDLARHRPDLAAAAARLHAATATIGVAVGDLYPRVTLGASFGLESTLAGRFGDWASRAWSIGPNISLPIFDAGRRVATVTLRERQQQEAAIAFQQAVLKAFGEVDDAVSAYNAERLRNAQLDDKVASSRDELQLAQARQRLGLTDFVPLLDAQRAVHAALRERVESDGRLRTALVAVYKALGDDGTEAPQATAIDPLDALAARAGPR